jgi:hypothetical protein
MRGNALLVLLALAVGAAVAVLFAGPPGGGAGDSLDRALVAASLTVLAGIAVAGPSCLPGAGGGGRAARAAREGFSGAGGPGASSGPSFLEPDKTSPGGLLETAGDDLGDANVYVYGSVYQMDPAPPAATQANVLFGHDTASATDPKGIRGVMGTDSSDLGYDSVHTHRGVAMPPGSYLETQASIQKVIGGGDNVADQKLCVAVCFKVQEALGLSRVPLFSVPLVYTVEGGGDTDVKISATIDAQVLTVKAQYFDTANNTWNTFAEEKYDVSPVAGKAGSSLKDEMNDAPFMVSVAIDFNVKLAEVKSVHVTSVDSTTATQLDKVEASQTDIPTFSEYGVSGNPQYDASGKTLKSPGDKHMRLLVSGDGDGTAASSARISAVAVLLHNRTDAPDAVLEKLRSHLQKIGKIRTARSLCPYTDPGAGGQVAALCSSDACASVNWSDPMSLAGAMPCREAIVALCSSADAENYPACACWTDETKRDTPSCKLWKQYVTGVTDPSLVNYQSLEALKTQYNLVSVDTTDLVREAVSRAQAQAAAASQPQQTQSTASSSSSGGPADQSPAFRHPGVSSPYPSDPGGDGSSDSAGSAAYGAMKHPGVSSPYVSAPGPSAYAPSSGRRAIRERRARGLSGYGGRSASASEALRLSRDALDDTGGGGGASGGYFRAIRDTLFG